MKQFLRVALRTGFAWLPCMHLVHFSTLRVAEISPVTCFSSHQGGLDPLPRGVHRRDKVRTFVDATPKQKRRAAQNRKRPKGLVVYKTCGAAAKHALVILRTFEADGGKVLELSIDSLEAGDSHLDRLSKATVSVVLQEWREFYRLTRRDGLDLLRELHACREWDLYSQVATWLLEEGWFQANIRDYTKLMDVYSKGARYEQAEGVWQAILSKRFKVDAAACTVGVSLFARQQKLEDAEDTFDKFVEQGGSIDVQLCTALVGAYCKIGCFERAESFLVEMSAAGCYPSIVTYVVLLNAYGKDGRLEQAEGTLQAIKDAGLIPNSRAYTAMADAYGRAGKGEQAKAMLLEMEARGIEVDDTALLVLLRAFLRGAMQEEAKKVIDLLTEGGKLHPAAQKILTEQAG